MPTSKINPKLTFNQAIEDFLAKLMSEAGMDEVSPEVKSQMTNDLRARLNDRLFATVIMNLTDDQVTKFRELAESNPSGDELEKFIDSHIPNSQEVFAGAMMQFRSNYLGLE